MTGADVKQLLKAEALKLGFHAMRCTRVHDDPKVADKLDVFLALNRHGDMDWMARHADRRRSPKALWPEAQTALIFALSYAPDHDPLDALSKTSSGTISVYAKGKDYHDVIKPKLKQLARQLRALRACDVKVFVDTAPLMEKPLAQRAGIGWQGKHTNLVSRDGGSWFFLGVILTTADLPPDPQETDHCGACSRCVDVCPTHAFPAPYQLDARRCISYLTIEHKGHIDREFRRPMGNRIYGCDDCLAVCPWNKFAVTARELRLSARAETENPPLKDLLEMDEERFRERFKGTAIKRTGRDRMLRNILIAAGNSGDSDLVPLIAPHLNDSSPIVRAMAVWALAELSPIQRLRDLFNACVSDERDSDVRAEWQQALSRDPTCLDPECEEKSKLTTGRRRS